MRSWVPGNLGRRRLPARPDGEARPRVTCRLVGKSSQGSRQLGGETRTPRQQGRVPWSGGIEGVVVNLSDVLELVASG
jgi:hypothetical protein